MTSSIILEQAFRNKAKFSELMNQSTPVSVSEILSNYSIPKEKTVIRVAELTQNFETLLDSLGDSNIPNLPQAPYLVWIVTQEKENVMNVLKTINKHATSGFGIFVFKASLNDNKIDFNCLLKPEIKQHSKRNTETPAKTLQLEYWQKYFEICDELTSEMQINPKPQHYQYISIGKSGVQIMQTANTQNGYVATEILINKDKEIFRKLEEHKAEIEKALGELDWQFLEGKLSSRIRKIYNVNISDNKTWAEAIKEHIKMAEEFKETFSKYL